jgi:hypothetical protein
LGKVAGGEGVFGLQRAFHIAGAKNVVASLWKVDDEYTMRLMTLFYENLWDKKLTALESLRQAQLSIYYGPDDPRGPKPAREPTPGRGTSRDPGGKAEPAPRSTGRRTDARYWAAWTLSGDPGPVGTAPAVTVTRTAAVAGATANVVTIDAGNENEGAPSRMAFYILLAVAAAVLGTTSMWYLRRRQR